MKAVIPSDVYKGFEKLGIVNERVVIHSSLSSFGELRGGAEALLDVIISSFKTVLMPAFCWDSVTVPPEGDRPRQNGCDYSFYDSWDRKPAPFVVENAGMERSIGIVSQRFLGISTALRSDHAWHSWAAYGDEAEQLTKYHPWDSTNLPLEGLSCLGGYIVLLGVKLNSCTAIHIAEERAGRRPFIRWAINRSGNVKRVRASGCAKGFNNILPFCKELFKIIYIGKCCVMVTPIEPFIKFVTSVILSQPEVTKCSVSCVRCRDAILGGPIE